MSLVKLPQGELTVLILVNQGGGEPVAGTSWRLLPQNCPVATAAAALEAQVRILPGEGRPYWRSGRVRRSGTACLKPVLH